MVLPLSILFLAVSSVLSISVIELTPENVDQNMKDDRFRFVLFYSPWQVECKDKVKMVDEVAKVLSDDYVIAKLDVYKRKKLAYRYHVESFCEFRYLLRGTMVPERYEGPISKESILNFIKLKSQDEMHDGIFKRPIIELDSNNFDRIVKDKGKHVMVLYYTTWCESCTELLKTMTKVSRAFKNEPKCVIAAMNGEKNYDKTKWSKVGVYPTLVFFPPENKDGNVYLPGKNHERWSPQNMTKFLNMHCKTKRTSDGTLDKMVGRYDALDKLARYFIRNSHKRDKAIREAVQSIQQMDTVQREFAHYYVKVMRGIQTEGEQYLDLEIERIEKLFLSDLNLDKRDELTKKKNVLQYFRISRRDEL